MTEERRAVVPLRFGQIVDPKRASVNLRDLYRAKMLKDDVWEKIYPVIHNGDDVYGAKELRWDAVRKILEDEIGEEIMRPFLTGPKSTNHHRSIKARTVVRERLDVEVKSGQLTGGVAPRLRLANATVVATTVDSTDPSGE